MSIPEHSGAHRSAPPRGGPFPGASVLAVCGWKNSGKTTLIETALPRLRDRGLQVAVLKHDAHGLRLDQPGTDSQRLFAAGADVLVHGPGEAFQRTHQADGKPLGPALCELCGRYDLVLMEGHKQGPLPKVWLQRAEKEALPEGVRNVAALLPPGEGRTELLLGMLDDWLPGWLARLPLLACVLPHEGPGRGTPEAIPETVAMLRGATDGVAVVGGTGRPAGDEVLLPPAPDGSGPAAGLLSAMRWHPRAAWLAVRPGPDELTPAVVARLRARWRPGVRVCAEPEGTENIVLCDFRAQGLVQAAALAAEPGLATLPAREQARRRDTAGP